MRDWDRRHCSLDTLRRQLKEFHLRNRHGNGHREVGQSTPIRKVQPLPAPTSPRLSRHWVQSCYAHPRDIRWDVLDLVWKSHIHFDGETDSIPFLKRFAELQEHFAISPDTMLTVLPEMLTNKALEWYWNNRCNTNRSFAEICGQPSHVPITLFRYRL